MKQKNVLLAAGALIIIGAALFLAIRSNTAETNMNDVPESHNSSEQNKNEANLDPPTESEQAAGDKTKEEILKEQDTDSNRVLPTGANIAIVDAAQYEQEIEVRAFVSNVVTDGTCTYKFTKDNFVVERTVDAFADATTTPCVNLFISREEFQAYGEWNMTVTYQNDTIKGSASKTLQIE